MNNFAFFASHPDDLEIAAGGTISKLSSQYSVKVFIFTDDHLEKDTRRQEAINAAYALGLTSNDVHFLGMKDGELNDDRFHVSAIREYLKEIDYDPDLVFTHTDKDSHNDHRAAHKICWSAFREKIILCYGVVNHIDNRFNPTVFVNTDKFRDHKLAALDEHKSQIKLGRILFDEIEVLDKKMGGLIDCEFAESYELIIQRGGEKYLSLIDEINNNSVSNLWNKLINGEAITYIHAVQVQRDKKEYNWSSNRDRDGISNLRNTLRKFYVKAPDIDEKSCNQGGIETVLEKKYVILGGGAVSNSISRTYFNHFPNIRYVIDYDMPQFSNIRIHDRLKNIVYKAQYDAEKLGDDQLEVDMAILTIMVNPMSSENKILIGCMGIHGYGSYCCYNYLCEPDKINQLNKILYDDTGIIRSLQVLLRCDSRINKTELIQETIHYL